MDFPHSVDSSASSSGSFEFLRAYAAEMTIAARWIEMGFVGIICSSHFVIGSGMPA